MSAQQTTAIFHNFKHFPPGLYQETGQAYRNGKPFGQPLFDNHCADVSSPQTVEAIKQMQWDIAPTCSMKVTVDTPTEAQSVQTCDPGALQTVIRRTSKRIDDQTVTTDTEMSKGGQQITATHTTLKYLGACPAGITSLSGVPKPSAEECARLPEMREQVKAATCHNGALPAAYVAQCEAAMKTMQVNMQQLEGICKK